MLAGRIDPVAQGFPWPVIDGRFETMTDLELTDEERRIAGKIAADANISGWAGMTTALLFLASPGILTYQVIIWLKTAEWPPLAWSDAFNWAHPKPIRWKGLALIVDWVGQLPLFLLPLALIGVLTLLWWNRDEHDTPEVRKVRAKLANTKYRGAMKKPEKETPAA